jgi:uncharacterized integral membrane protein
MRREHENDPDPGQGPPIDPMEQQRQLQKARQRRVVKWLVALVLLVIFIVFIAQNSRETRIDFVFFNRHPKLIWIMLACGIIGGIIGYLVGRPGKQVRIRRKKDEPPKH